MKRSTDDSAVTLYQSFMEEIKARLAALQSALTDVTMNPSPQSFLGAEFAFLQLRYICELVALAAVAAHGELVVSKDLLKSWHPDEIFRLLAEINADCFPRAIKNTRGAEGIVSIDFADDRSMTQDDLAKIYGRCGDTLHRGAIKHYLTGKSKNYDVAWVQHQAQRIASFLADHSVFVRTRGKVFLVLMSAPPHGGVQVAVAKSMGAFVAPDGFVYDPEAEGIPPAMAAKAVSMKAARGVNESEARPSDAKTKTD